MFPCLQVGYQDAEGVAEIPGIVSFEEDCACPGCEPADNGPGADGILGDEAAGLSGIDKKDIEPGKVV